MKSPRIKPIALEVVILTTGVEAEIPRAAIVWIGHGPRIGPINIVGLDIGEEVNIRVRVRQDGLVHRSAQFSVKQMAHLAAIAKEAQRRTSRLDLARRIRLSGGG